MLIVYDRGIVAVTIINTRSVEYGIGFFFFEEAKVC